VAAVTDELAGRVAVVTGGASGIGSATALLLAQRGLASSWPISMPGQRRGSVPAAISARVDVTDWTSCVAMFEANVTAFGPVNIAANSAGVAGPKAPTGEYPLAGWTRVMAVNADGVFLSMRAEIPALLAAGGGAIVNVASVLGTVGSPDKIAYAASKQAVIG
jgi:NAD(P)-dependent dehydrogenase (short-subunit alcohol dehydrogenase family)